MRLGPWRQPRRITHPDGFFVEQDYLVTGEMTRIRERDGASDVPVETGIGVLATFEYDQLGRRTRLTLGNGAVTDYGYDPVSRLATLGHDLAGTAYDNAVTFTYNPASQIVGRSATGSAYAWTGHGSGSTATTPDGLNRIPSWNSTLSWDSKGNMTFDGTKTYAYDSENRAASVNGTAFHYDPLGRLAGTGSPIAIAYENYVDGLVAERTPGVSAVQRRHVFGPGVDEPIVWYAGSGTTDRRFLSADERGSIVAVSDGSGAVRNVIRYEEYGRLQHSDGYWLPRFAFTGQRYFSGNGVYYYKNRLYDPKSGRFMQTDPIGYEGGMNLYAYVGGDPVNFTDPLGLAENEIIITGRPLHPQNPPPPPTRAGTWGQISPGAGGNPERGEDRSQKQQGCDGPEDDPTNCAEVSGPPDPQPQLESILPAPSLALAPTHGIRGLSRRECAAVLWGTVAAGAQELVSISIHLARGATIAEIAAGSAAAGAVARLVAVGLVAGGTIYVLDRLTDGAVAAALGRATGICR